MFARAVDSKKRMQKHLLAFLRSNRRSTKKPVLNSLNLVEARNVPKNEGEWIT
jgi:hypothetical protein